ncbi:MAG: hypothetical protein WBV82_08100 [Myxococcaceae bacterium]
MTTSAAISATVTLQFTDFSAWIPAVLGSLLVLVAMMMRPTLKAVPVRFRRSQRRNTRR